MLDARNIGVVTGGLTADPEPVGNGKVIKIRLGVDYAGSERDNPDNRSGYFDVTYFLDESSPNGKFVKSQIDQGKLKKGSSVSVIYRLQQERWKDKDSGSNRQSVVLIAESINYAGRGGGEKSDGDAPAASAGARAAAPMEF